MATEIEHKYLVVNDSYKQLAIESHTVAQGYLSRDAERVVRVRVKDGDQGYLTVKGKGNGLERPEFEYTIPTEDAKELLKLCLRPVISKTRYIVMHDGNRWEVDEFHDALQGLTVAELEVPDAGYTFALPEFVGREVTDDPKYTNAALSAVAIDYVASHALLQDAKQK